MTYKRKLLNVPSAENEVMKNLVAGLNGELEKIEAESSRPEVRGVQFEARATIPSKYKEGDLYYGLAGVFGGSAGLYVRDVNSWRKL